MTIIIKLTELSVCGMRIVIKLNSCPVAQVKRYKWRWNDAKFQLFTLRYMETLGKLFTHIAPS